MNEYFNTNKKNWNERVGIHKKSRFYDVEGFIKGRSSLDRLELEELGDVKGKRLLHLQCHFGMSTLSLARLGAEVTGADFSDKAIELAKELTEQTGLKAEFVCSNVLELDEHLKGEYDIVFASYGVFCWINDLNRWFEIASYFLKPGGELVILDGHPTNHLFEYNEEKKEIEMIGPYFNNGPHRYVEDNTYTDGDEKLVNNVEYEWAHPVSEFINSAVKNGLRIKSFKEYPFMSWNRYPNMVKNDEGYWYLEGKDLPFTFSMKCVKEKFILTLLSDK
ncbi:MAG: class I SAM-dependent methyltransferase [Candidatus Delongbacteria bacterium]|nr:class I SAM-dependent methyltransferase [Candidatus Delongbacteria bacterium]MDD4204999.1 class I SAM-dependent methyltransferase [Candidatus Delongbacteria bacterium]